MNDLYETSTGRIKFHLKSFYYNALTTDYLQIFSNVVTEPNALRSMIKYTTAAQASTEDLLLSEKMTWPNVLRVLKCF